MNMLEKFAAIEKLTKGIVTNNYKNLLITGAPGLGKTFGVLKVLQKEKGVKYINGSISPVGLYCALYNNRKSNNTIVLDDADDILFKQDAINVLKCAMDTTQGREVTWEKYSNVLLIENVPKQFTFEGKVIIISNLNFIGVKKKQTKTNIHLNALADRCLHLDLNSLTIDQKIERIAFLVNKHNLFAKIKRDDVRKEILDWISQNKNNLSEVNCRTAMKVCDIYQTNKQEWQTLARETLCV